MSIVLPSNAALSYRTATGSPDTYTNIPGVTDFDEGGSSADQNDTTDYDSAGDRKEFEPGLIDSSNGSIVLNYTPGDTVHEDLREKIGTIQRFKSVDVAHTTILDALIIGVSRPRKIGGKRTMTITIKLTGNPTETDA